MNEFLMNSAFYNNYGTYAFLLALFVVMILVFAGFVMKAKPKVLLLGFISFVAAALGIMLIQDEVKLRIITEYGYKHKIVYYNGKVSVINFTGPTSLDTSSGMEYVPVMKFVNMGTMSCELSLRECNEELAKNKEKVIEAMSDKNSEALVKEN